MRETANLQGDKGAGAIVFPPSSARRWMLENGLTVIVQEDRSAPVASVQAWCATGSMYEDKHLGAGLSHILEHMLFKGTKSRSTNEIAQKIQDVGGYINAYTSFDRTVFWIDVPKDGVGAAIDILSDAMLNSTLPPHEYSKEQEVIRREFAMGADDPERTLTQLLFSTAYQVHPYRLPVIGQLDIYNQLTQQDVLRYYKARYVPNNLTFVIVGDVETSRIRAQLSRLFARVPARSLQPVFIPPEPAQLGRREVHEEFATELTHLALAWHVPEIAHPDVPALDLLSVILGEGRSSRFYREIREERGLAFTIEAFCYTPGEPGLFGVAAVLNAEKRDATLRAIDEIIGQIRAGGVSSAELVKARKIILANELESLTTMRGQASDLGTNWFMTRNLNFGRQYLTKIQAVTCDDLRRVALKYLVDENLTVVSLNPKESLAPVQSKTSEISGGAIQKFELSNGLRVLVREDARLPLVWMAAVFRCGLLAETPETNGVTRLLAKALLRGTATRAAEQISGELESVGGEIEAEAGNNSIALRAAVTEPDLDLGLDVLADVLLHATLPEKEIAREKEIRLARIKEEGEEPMAVARDLVRGTLFAKHPFALRKEGSPSAIERITLEELRAFRDRYIVAQNGVLSIFGKVDAGRLKVVLEKKLGSLKGGQLALTNVPRPTPLRASKTVEEIRDKAQAVLMVGFQGSDVYDPDHYALEILDEASSDLGSRFFVRIREKMGLAYFVGAGQVQALVPGLFAFYLGTDPKKLDSVKAALLDEIRKLAQDGLTQAELDRARRKLIGAQQIQNQSNDMFAFMSALDELYGLGFDYHAKLEARVNALTRDDIRRAAKKFFGKQHYVMAIVRPPLKERRTHG